MNNVIDRDRYAARTAWNKHPGNIFHQFNFFLIFFLLNSIISAITTNQSTAKVSVT